MADYPNSKHAFRNGFFQGIGMSLGTTLGFTLISSLIVASLKIAGGLPIIGNFAASLIEATTTALQTRQF